MEISSLSDIEIINYIRDDWNKIVNNYIVHSQFIKDITFRTKYTDEFLKRMYISPGKYYLNNLYHICRPADEVIIEDDLSITFKYKSIW